MASNSDSLNPFLSANDQLREIRSGAISAEEITQVALARISEIDRNGYELKSVLALTAGIENSHISIDPTLPLAGLPLLIKDNIETEGLPATAGSWALNGFPIKKDSTIAARLRAAGANIIGATNLSEWANIRDTGSTSGWSGMGGLTANPWIHAHSAGGSSAGSGAAIAAGLASFAIGTETDGSIVCPASVNGCVGIKPTVGSIPRDGVIPVSSSQDSPGPMARTVADAALLLEVMADRTGFVAATTDMRTLRIGVVNSWLTEDEGTDLLFQEAIEKLNKSGFTLLEVELTPPDKVTSQEEVEIMLHDLHDDLAQYFSHRQSPPFSSLADLIGFNKENSEKEMPFFGQDLFERAILLKGRTGQYQAKRARNLTWAQKTLDQGLAEVDVLIGASYGPAWVSTLGYGDNLAKASWITTAPAIAGTPIGCLPMGLTQGLPVGLGVVARKNDEVRLITAMAQIERALALGILEPTFLK